MITKNICDREEPRDHYIWTLRAEPSLPFLSSLNSSHGPYFHVRKCHSKPGRFTSCISSSSWSHDPVKRSKGCHPSVSFFGLFLNLPKIPVVTLLCESLMHEEKQSFTEQQVKFLNEYEDLQTKKKL